MMTVSAMTQSQVLVLTRIVEVHVHGPRVVPEEHAEHGNVQVQTSKH
jgi:hypothetical protein